MERIMRIGLVKPGKEAEVREILRAGFPADAFQRIGMRQVMAFIGSGFFTILFEAERSFDETYEDFEHDPQIQAWVNRFAHYVDQPPAMTPERTAELALAGEAFHWQVGAA